MQLLDSGDSPSLASLLSLKGKVALVVGGSGYLGKEISAAFAELGAVIIVASRNLEKNIKFAEALNERFPDSEAQGFQVDITSEESLNSLYEVVCAMFPSGIDVLVNCGWSGKKNNFDTIDMKDWNQDIEICLSGVFRTIKTFLPLLMLKQGNILNVASMYGHVAPDYRLYDGSKNANPPSYGAAKGGVIQLTKYLASFLATRRIRVNCISPGPFPFKEVQEEDPEFIARLSQRNPLNRIGKPFEVKGAAILLCSDAGSFMTGQNVCVDGGWSVW